MGESIPDPEPAVRLRIDMDPDTDPERADTRTGTVEGRTGVPLSFFGHRVAVSPDGRRLYVANEDCDGQLFVIDAETMRTLAEPVDLPGLAADIAVSPDSSRVFVSLTDKGEVATFPANDPHAVSRLTLQQP